MKITPFEVRERQFKVRLFKGYDIQEVDVYLDLVAQEIEELLEENSILRDENRRLTEQLKQYQQTENTIKEALVSLQKATQEIKATAEREAQVIISEAELKAEQILREADGHRANILAEAEKIKGQKAQLAASLRANLESHLRLLEGAEGEKTG